MQTGIVPEKSIERPFAVSLANAQTPGLPEEIRRDDVAALREEFAMFVDAYVLSKDGAYVKKATYAYIEIEKRIAQAQAAGFDTEGW